MRKSFFVCLFISYVFLFNLKCVAQYHYGKITGMEEGAKMITPYGIHIVGNFAYITGLNSKSVDIIDISDPDDPQLVSSLLGGDGGFELKSPIDIIVSGNYAYISNEKEPALEIANISDPENPIFVGSFNGANGTKGIQVNGNFAYLSNIASDVTVLDISDRTNPTAVGSCSGSVGTTQMEISGNKLFCVKGADLVIFDISNPSSPSLSGTYTSIASTSTLREVKISGNTAYLVRDNYFEIADINNPASVQYLGGYSYSIVGNSLSLSGNVAHVGGNNGFLTLDIGNPASIVLLDALNIDTYFQDISGDYVFSVHNHLEVIDVSNPANLSYKSLFQHSSEGLAISGNYAYIAKAHNALEVVDVSNPAFPKNTGSLSDGEGGAKLQNPTSVAVSGNYAYVTSANSNALEIVNISNPATPVHVASLVDGQGGAKLNRPMSIVLQGNYAFIASYGSNALEVVDISNPASPVHAASLEDGQSGAVLLQPQSIVISGNHAYVAGVNGIEIVNISNPASLVHVATETSAVEPKSLAINGNYLICYDYFYIYFINISNPALPVLESNFNGTSIGHDFGAMASLIYTTSISVSNDHLYIASSGYDELIVVDISDIYNPSFVGAVAHQQSGALLRVPGSVQVVGDFCYVTSYISNGLEVIYFNPSTPNEPNLVLNDYTKTYGDADFSLVATSSNSAGTISYGKVSGTSVDVLTNGLTSIDAAGTSEVYAQIAADGTYGPKAVAADVIVSPKAISVSANTGQSKAVGASDPTFAYTATPSLVSGDAFTGALSRQAGETAGSYNILQGSLSAGANYQITYTGTTFCVNPEKPTITELLGIPPTLQSSSATGNMWYRDGNLESGNSTDTYVCNTSGVYTVRLYVDNCLSELSDAVNVTVNDLEEALKANVNIFPNPVREELTVDVSALPEKCTITLIDAEGKILSTKESNTSEVLDFKNQAAGMYTIKIVQNGNATAVKVVKQ